MRLRLFLHGGPYQPSQQLPPGKTLSPTRARRHLLESKIVSPVSGSLTRAPLWIIIFAFRQALRARDLCIDPGKK